MSFDLIDKIMLELQRGSVKRKHGFKTFVFRSLSSMRTVVLRKVDLSSKTLVIYTDERAKKVEEIHEDIFVGCLFWDKKIGYQLRIKGKAKLEINEAIITAAWSNLQPQQKGDYATLNPPGCVTLNPDEIKYEEERAFSNFAIINISITEIEFLELGSPHKRALLKKGNGWKPTWLIP